MSGDVTLTVTSKLAERDLIGIAHQGYDIEIV